MKNFFLFLLSCCALAAGARTIPVGPGEVVNSLRKAVALASAGDTVLLKSGTYREGNIVIDKGIHLIGLNAPVLDGENKYEILTATGQGIEIRGITFRNSGYSSMNDYASISLIDARDCIVEENRIENAYFAIHVANAFECLIRRNTIIGQARTEQTSGNGIHLWKCENIVVEENDIQGHRDGIYFEFVTRSYVWKNTSHENVRYGLHFMFSNNDSYVENSFRNNGAGVAVMYSHHVLMHRNRFDANWGPNAYGLLLKEISDARIYGNDFHQNTVGILMESTNRVEATANRFRNNGWALRIQASCNENEITGNNFETNTFDVATNGTMMLNKFSYNYWDKYEGYDINRDGQGDVAYHPVSMYSMVIEQNPNSVLLLRSFMVSLLDKAEKAIPSLTPENLTDEQPVMRRYHYDSN
jgi:nitrous oxidase accessory protein